MGDRHDYVALEWVKGEIAETLKQARQALEEFVENPEDSTRLRFCLTYVHQVHGTLQMVEFFGAALLAEEMEQLAQALLEGRVNNLAESLEVMMQAILQLPLYLDRIQTARRDLPMVVLPLLNDLRAARGEKLLSETSLFSPSLPDVSELLTNDRLQQLNTPDLPMLLRKLRQMLQLSLVNVLRGEDLATNLNYMARVFARLETLSKNAPLQPLWQVAAGLVDGLANGSVETGASVRNLLRQVDAELRRLVTEQAQGLNQPAATELIKNILFYVAKAQPNSARLQALHAQYRLDEALPDELLLDEERARMSGPDRGAMRSVVAALCEELVRIKDNLDLFVRSDRSKLDELNALQAPLKQIADTLAVLGFAQPRKVVLDQIDVVASLVAGEAEPSEAVLMDIAGALLYIEATLTGMVGAPDQTKNEQNLLPTTDVGQIHRLVIKEARTGLEHAKDGIIEFIASQWNHDHLANVPYLLNQVRGGLVMIPLERAAALVETCRRYIEEQLFEQKIIPNWQNLDTLADAITSVEYYLERLAEDHASQGEAILDVAEQSLTSLGYTPREPVQVEHDLFDSESEQNVVEVTAGESDSLSELVSDSSDALEQASELTIDAVAVEDSLAAEPTAYDFDDAFLAYPSVADDSVEGQTDDSDHLELDNTVSEQLSVDTNDIPDVELPDIVLSEFAQLEPAELSLEDVMSSSVQSVNPPATDVPLSILPPPADEEAIDEELREVFVEEAEEVLATLNEFYPKWRADQDDKQALTEVRRAFHTLKGSGRMIRALVAGELAWSIENMLNRVIEGSIDVTEPALQVIADVIELFPELVVEYAAQQQRQRDDVDELAAIAHALARKQPLPSVTDTTASAKQDVVDPLQADEKFDFEIVTDSEPASSAESIVDNAEVIDPVLLEIFKNEAQAHLQTLVGFLADCAQQLPKMISDDLQRALHTLKGSAFMAGILPIAHIASVLEKLAKEYQANLLAIEFNEALLLSEAEQLLCTGIEQLDSSPLKEIDGAEGFIGKLEQVMRERLAHAEDQKSADPKGARDPKVISSFLAEGMDLLLDMDEQLQDWQTHPTERQELAALLAELAQLSLSAEQAELPQVVDMCNALLDIYKAVESGRLLTQERFFEQAKQAHDALLNMMDQVAAGLQVEPQQDCIDALYELMAEELQPAMAVEDQTIELFEPTLEPLLEQGVTFDTESTLALAEVGDDVLEGTEPEQDNTELTLLERSLETPEVSAVSSVDENFSVSNLDEEMVEIFLEEAMDLLESAGESLDTWLAAPQNNNVMSALLRDLHTLKGGARMAEIKPIGDLAHELESLYEGLLDGRYSHSQQLGEMLLQGHDRLAVLLDQLQARQPMQQPTALIEGMKALRRGEVAPMPVADMPEDEQILAIEPSVELVTAEVDAELSVRETALSFDAEEEQDVILSDVEPVADDHFVLEHFDDELTDDQPLLELVDSAVDLSVPQAEQSITLEVPVIDQPAEQLVHEDQLSLVADSVADLRDPELVEIFLEEGFEIIESATAALLRWIGQPDNTLELETLQRDLHTLKGGARMAEIPEIGDLAHELEFLYEDLSAGKLKASAPVINLLQDSHDTLAVMLEAVRDYKDLPDGQALIDEITRMRRNPHQQLDIPSSVQLQPAQAPSSDNDDEVLSIFIVEADELLAEFNSALTAFADSEQSAQAIQDALRVLNTLKGGARLAEVESIGDISHDLEGKLFAAQQQGQPWPENLQADLQRAYEQLLAEVASIRTTLPEHLQAQQLMQPVQASSPVSHALQLAQPIVAVSEVARHAVDQQVLPFVEKAQQQAAESSAQRAPQELVRVPADLLENLVNLAGETSIFRGRVEQQVSDFGFTLGEMEATIDRVRDQLRRLDTETQAQILSRHQAETEKAGYEEFDPLEMDRYSQLQQLSRALFESSSDLLDLKETLAARTRDAETLLLQQARVNTELQEGLMRTRMVPFDRLLPRLRRVVRQVSGELGKNVEFLVGNAEGEVDRSVLERMLAPLEHMLRNAVDHGIESAEQRSAAGKPAAGTIRLELSREGADILLVLADDGAGINLPAVRNKALERGLVTADSVLTDQEVMQFILHAGFSTAGQITQISGRGVGMDVVSSEIKQIGGSISIDSQPSKGTTFYIRLPFTVSVNRALMVMAGEDSYAIPLNTIEGIVRISPYELEALYEQERKEGQAASFEYAGQTYELTYIGDLLNNGQHPKLVGQTLPLPVILVRSNEYAVAVQVDVLAGSREIVVKSLGSQFSNVHGISGATILGDGRVVVILDLLATIRTQYARQGLHNASEMTRLEAVDVDKSKAMLVMVVDDSVTVRKVTTRLLERHGMNVLTAKDGVDAIALLQETKPDIMLLDIEMPRMDGFEVATLVRHDEHLQDLPIIMITSRTGEKHRERAMAIGVNDYLGKPYQESVLLEAIHKLIKSDD